MKVECIPRGEVIQDQRISARAENDRFIIEGPWDDVARVLSWCKVNLRPSWDSTFIHWEVKSRGEAAYVLEIEDEADAIMFRMMWQ